VHLIGFAKEIILWCTALWTSNLVLTMSLAVWFPFIIIIITIIIR